MTTLADIDLREGYADLSEARLHYVEAGSGSPGPPVVLLHGFPEFWYSWRHQIPALAAAGLRVIAPDMRGYNLSSKPPEVSSYTARRLAGDIHELIRERGAERAFLAGHDWGAAVAWVTAMAHPDAVERLAILNVPHPRQMLRALRRPSRQLARSWYIFFYQLPWLPERAMRADDWRAFRHGFEHDARPGAFTPVDIDRYREAWSQPGALTATLNYYRAAIRRPPSLSRAGSSAGSGAGVGSGSGAGSESGSGAGSGSGSEAGAGADAGLAPIEAPTLVIWGERDRYLGAELAEPDSRDVPHLHRVVRLPEASHWVQHDCPDRVSELLIGFFKA